MTPFAANPFVFIFSGVLLVAVLGYFGWGALDRLGLSEEQAAAVVVRKQLNPPGVTYRTTIAGGRAWTLTDPTAETYVLELKIGDEPTVAVVSQELYNTLRPGDPVQLRLQRTRLSGRLEVTAVSR